VLPSALIAEPLRHKPGTMNGLQRRVAFTAMHEYDRNRRRYYFYFETLLFLLHRTTVRTSFSAWFCIIPTNGFCLMTPQRTA
jgi:hypothetical protein